MTKQNCTPKVILNTFGVQVLLNVLLFVYEKRFYSIFTEDWRLLGKNN